jgi:hypothetical protein
MARPRKPTNVLHLTGAFKHDPKRAAARVDEPEPEGDIGDPPAHLSDGERLCWIELVGLCHEGVLCAADRPFLEYGARVWNQLRSEQDIDPKLGIRFETVCARLGMTPADRSKVSARKKDGGKDPYSEFGAAG